jgi:hypothetical protein
MQKSLMYMVDLYDHKFVKYGFASNAMRFSSAVASSVSSFVEQSKALWDKHMYKKSQPSIKPSEPPELL